MKTRAQTVRTQLHFKLRMTVYCAWLINFLMSAIEEGFGTGAWVARKMPSDQLYALRPTLSFISRWAPFDTRNSMMESDPRFAAPIAAVRPIELVAFTSIPSS